MTPPRYVAEEVDVDWSAPSITRLWSANLGSVEGDLDEKLDWYYRRAPSGRGRVVALRLLEGEVPGPIVGCIGIGTRRVLAGDRALQAALLADLVVNQQHRTRLPALMLVERARDLAAEAADFQYGFPNQLAVGLFDRLGYQRLGDMSRYARALRFAPFIARWIGNRGLVRVAGAVLDVVDRLHTAPWRLGAGLGYRLDWPDGPEPAFDALFDEARRQYPMIADRGSDFLRWRFFARSGGASRLCALRRRRGGELRGYAVVTGRGSVAHLSDFLAGSPGELEALLRLLLPRLTSQGYSSVSVRFLGPRTVPQILARCGFRLRPEVRAVVYAAGDGRPVPDGDFYLTDADEDN